MSILAIHGHKTRGKEVIEILKMLGGKTTSNILGNDTIACYYIDNKNIKWKHYTYFDDACILTLEEFEQRYPYLKGKEIVDKDNNIGTIIHIKWFEDINHIRYQVSYDVNNYDTSWWRLDEITIIPFQCGDRVKTIYGKIGIISKPIWSERDKCIRYELESDLDSFYFENELELYKEEGRTMNDTPKTYKEVNKYLLENRVKNAQNLLDIEKCLENDGMKLPENITIHTCGIGVIDFIKWYESKQYPQTYKECCEILFPNSIELGKPLTSGYKGELLQKLGQLLICRDAYWKIAGEEIGLDSPWNPVWEDTNTQKHCIYYVGNEIKKQPMLEVHHFLAFPTAEMRDAFYDNFKELIEACKEIL